MKETTFDWTRVKYCHEVTVHIDGLIDEVGGEDPWHADYTDTDITLDDVAIEGTTNGNVGLVTSATCAGDTDGEDICGGSPGACSYCEITLACVDLEISM